MRDRKERDFYNLAVLALLLLALAVIFGIDLIAIPEHIPATVIYALPILATALLLRPRFVGIVTATAIILNVSEFVITGTIFWSWLVAAAILTLVGYLALTLAGQTRRAEAATRELQELQAERQAFTAMVTHELKGILTVLSGYTEALQRWERMTGERRVKAIDTILKQTQRLNRLVGELGDASAIETGNLTLNRQPCDLIAAAKVSVEENRIITANHELLLQTDENALVGHWDCGKIRQVLDNLIGNAIKYSPAGGEVRVTVSREAEVASVAVTDQGVGIPQEELGNLFKPYYRAPGTREIKGVGLGLYIVKEIVETHGGRVHAESVIGSGSTFIFELPLTHEPVRSDLSQTSPPNVPG